MLNQPTNRAKPKLKIWTVKRLIAAAEASKYHDVRRTGKTVMINRVTFGGDRREGVTIYKNLTIHRNDIELHLATRLRPQDAARVLRLER